MADATPVQSLTADGAARLIKDIAAESRRVGYTDEVKAEMTRLSINPQQLAHSCRNAVVYKKPVIDKFGNTEVLCSDFNSGEVLQLKVVIEGSRADGQHLTVIGIEREAFPTIHM